MQASGQLCTHKEYNLQQPESEKDGNGMNVLNVMRTIHFITFPLNEATMGLGAWRTGHVDRKSLSHIINLLRTLFAEFNYEDV